MRTVILVLATLFLCLSSFGQISTIVIKNKLVIPENPQKEVIPITRKELADVELITSKLGDIEQYTIYFKLDSNLFMKTVTTNILEPNIKRRILMIKDGSHFGFDNVLIQLPGNKGTITKTYEFILEY